MTRAGWIIGAAAALLAASSPFDGGVAQEYAGKTLVIGVWGGDIERLLKGKESRLGARKA